MQLNPASLFSGTRDIDATIVPMCFPFLINYAFDAREGNAFVPTALSVVLQHVCQTFAARTGSDPLKDRLERSLKAAVSSGGWPNGFFGTENLPLNEIVHSHHPTDIIVGMTGAKIGLRRYGDCLGLRACDGTGELHKEMTALLTELAESDGRRDFIRSFIHRYNFNCAPELKDCRDGRRLSIQDEIAVMRSYLPDITWSNRSDMVMMLVRDFIEGDGGIKVGFYGDADLYLRIACDREVNDSTWRRGLIGGNTDREVMFRTSSGIRPRVEYFIRTVAENNPYQAAPLDIDYNHEQYALRELARMIHTALYQRMHQYRVDHGNPHLIRFQREPEKAVA